MAKKERGVFEKVPGSGVWWIRWSDGHGRIRRERIGPKSLAKEAYQRRKVEVKMGTVFPENLRRKREMLFKDLVKIYLEDHAKPNKRSWRDDLYRSNLLIEVFGDKALSEISTQDIERFKARLAERVAKGTVNLHIGLLKTIFNKGIRWEKTENNPAREVKLFPINNHSTRFLSFDEEERLKIAMKPDHWLLVEFAIHTGLRRSEQFNLRWEDIDFGNRSVTAHAKGGGVRYVTMNDRVIEILRGLPSRLKSKWVFPSQTNITPKEGKTFVKRVFKPAIEKAGIAPIRWHDLRHTFGSRLVMRNVPLRTVQELMGHSQISMTQRYTHLSPRHLLDGVQALLENRKEDQIEVHTGTATDTEQEREVEKKG